MFYNEFGWFISTPFCFVYVCMCLRSFVSEQYILYRILSRHRSTIYYLHLDVFRFVLFSLSWLSGYGIAQMLQDAHTEFFHIVRVLHTLFVCIFIYTMHVKYANFHFFSIIYCFFAEFWNFFHRNLNFFDIKFIFLPSNQIKQLMIFVLSFMKRKWQIFQKRKNYVYEWINER